MVGGCDVGSATALHEETRLSLVHGPDSIQDACYHMQFSV